MIDLWQSGHPATRTPAAHPTLRLDPGAEHFSNFARQFLPLLRRAVLFLPTVDKQRLRPLPLLPPSSSSSTSRALRLRRPCLEPSVALTYLISSHAMNLRLVQVVPVHDIPKVVLLANAG